MNTEPGERLNKVHSRIETNAVDAEGVSCMKRLAPWLKQTSGLYEDFIFPNGKRLELKTETRDLRQTKNFFVETENVKDNGFRWSGGPFAAYNNGVNFYGYLFLKHERFYLFETSVFRKIAWSLIRTGEYKRFEIKNETHITYGYALPREAFREIVIRNYKGLGPDEY